MTCAPRQGAGQVIGMGDTGLDMGHCLLRDDAVPVPATLAGGLQQEPDGGALYFDSTAHRKLRYYRLADDGVDANGHGTHCGGSAAGSPQANGTGARLRSRCSARAGPACLWHPAMRSAARPCMPALHSRSSAAAEPGSRSAGAMAPQPIAQTGDQRKAAPAPRAAGSADWQGMAPAAKLAFQDLGAGTSGTIDLGGDLATDYYPYTYARSVALRSQLACSALHESGGSDQRPGALPRRPCAACAQRAAAMPCSHLCAAVPSHWSGALPSRSPCASGTPGLRRPTPGSALLGWQDTRRALGDRRGAAGHGRAGARACTPTRGARRRRTTTASRSTWTPLPGRACTNALHLSTLTCSCAAWLPLALDVDTFAWARLHKPIPALTALPRCLFMFGGTAARATREQFMPAPESRLLAHRACACAYQRIRRPRWRAQAHQDFLPVFAAGNLGESELPSSLSSPAVAKNCLAVGAPPGCCSNLCGLPRVASVQ